MLIRNVSRLDLERALAEANKHFEGNVIFNRCEPANQKQTAWNVTLKVKSSKGKGAKVSHNAEFWGGNLRYLPCACWHAHGYFLDALPPEAVVHTAGHTVHPGDTWQDWNVGSQLYPVYFSELCDCP